MGLFDIVYVISQNHVVLIERLGKFHRVQQQGLHMRMPFFERCRAVSLEWGDSANKDGIFIELSEQQTDTKARQCQTKDNVTIQQLDAVVYWRILSPEKALYEVDHLPRALADSALNSLRANVGMLSLDDLLSARTKLNDAITVDLSEITKRWGVRILRVEVQEIHYDDATANAMRQQMEAERKARAAILEAEGLSQAKIRLAEAEREAAVIRAQGEAQATLIAAQAEQRYVEAISAKLSPEMAAKALIAMKYIDGFQVITSNPAHKVFVPSSFSGIMMND